VYLSIITQALALSAWLVFNRNEMNLGRTNGLADFKTIFGFRSTSRRPSACSTSSPALTLVAAWTLCRWITRSRAGKVLVAIRDSETRVLFSGYSPASYKLFVFVSRRRWPAWRARCTRRRSASSRRPRWACCPSIEMVVWVAAGGRGTLIGAVLGPSASTGSSPG
jgi:urea transport system permease protein